MTTFLFTRNVTLAIYQLEILDKKKTSFSFITGKTELVISKTTQQSLVHQPIKQKPCPLPQRSNALSDKKGKKHIDEARQQYDRLSSITAEQSFLSP